jgi:hypothetical protein
MPSLSKETAKMSELTKVEYQVKPVTRYVITRYSEGLSPCRTGELVPHAGVSTRGEYENGQVAYEVAYALAKADHDRMGWPVGDERIRYPDNPTEAAVAA